MEPALPPGAGRRSRERASPETSGTDSSEAEHRVVYDYDGDATGDAPLLNRMCYMKRRNQKESIFRRCLRYRAIEW